MPGGYNRDLQDCKWLYMKGLEIARTTLRILAKVVKGMKVDPAACRAAFTPGVFATDVALRKVAAGTPWRDAYHEVRDNLGQLDAENPEDLFGMANNPAMQFAGRGYATSLSNSLAQMQPEKRKLIYAVFNALDPLPDASSGGKRDKVDYCLLVAARVMKNYDAVAALQKDGKLDRANLVPILYPDVEASPESSNSELSNAVLRRLSQNPMTMGQIMFLAENSGATFDEAEAALASGTRLENAPGISSFTGKLEEMDGTARGGRNTMVLDLSRASPPVYTENEEPVLPEENVKFVFHFPQGETLEAINGSESDPVVVKASKAIADKVAELCGNIHPKQLSNVYYALSQSALSVNVNGGFLAHGISSNEHMAVTFSLSRNDETGAVTIKYSEPEGFPVKFNWTVTVNVDGSSTSTPMRIDHGQYEAKAMSFADQIAAKLPGKSEAAAKNFIKDVLAYCGDDFELKDVVSRTIRGLCITATATMRTHDEIKARIDAIRANLEEVRKAAAGNNRIEKAGFNLPASSPSSPRHRRRSRSPRPSSRCARPWRT